MSRNDTRKPSLDAILGWIREDEPTQHEIEAAADRVRAKLGFDAPAVQASAIHIESCAGFQALIPDSIAGRLPRATALLLEDHSRECIPCRRALLDARRPAAASAARSTAAPNRMRWLVAASLAATAVLAGYTAWRAIPGLAGGPEMKVVRVEGDLFRVSENALVPLQAGMVVPASDVVRTGKDSGALLELSDGSKVEMRDRTEFGVSGRRGGSTIQLGNGSIIVEAAPQGAGRLRVTTDDCLVSVKGTIFSVNHGTKGSRVSVVEGSVEMEAGGSERLLRSGDSGTTSASVETIAVADEIAWSRDSERYGKLLQELASLRKDLDARVPNPALRYGSSLLDKMPQETVLYVAIPNITQALLEARQVFMEHVAESEALQEWWNQHMSSPEHQREFDEAFENLREVGGLLGDEVVIALAMGENGKIRGPMVTAEVSDLWALRRTLKNDAPEFDLESEVTVSGKVVTIEPKRKGAERATLSGFDFKGNPFRERLAATYQDGVSWVFGADLKKLIGQAASEAAALAENGARVASTWEEMGLLDARYLIAERDESATSATMRAELTFDGPRRGIAGWVSAPAPMGALEFVSPDATFAAAGVVKRPEILIAEAIGLIGADGTIRVDDFKTETGVDPIHDIAGALGGDVAIAVDGPFLPVPSWKVIIEVYDAPRLQGAFEKLTRRFNEKFESAGRAERVVFGSEEAGNRTDWVLRITGSEMNETQASAASLRYTIVDGYLVAAPSRVLLDRAIEQRENGYTLTRSAAFAERMPRDGNVNVSALVWQNLGPSLGPIASNLAGVLGNQGVQNLNAFAQEAKPSLITLSAGDDRIVLSSQGDPGFGSMLGSVFSMGQLQMLTGRLHASALKHDGEDAP